MALKENLHEKFEKEVVKMDINGETVYLKKGGFLFKEWQRVYPPVNEDGSWNWKNAIFGGTQGFIRSTIYFLLALLVFFAFYEYTRNLTAFINQPVVQTCLEKAGYTIKTGLGAAFG